jgi:hypothetical protein
MAKEKVFIYYHYKEGQIFRRPEIINRRDLFQSTDKNDKEGEKSEGLSRL